METEVSKLESAWWNTKPRLEKSEWLAENVKGLDKSVKDMLLLIERDGDLSGEKAGSNHLKQHELVACMEEILHRHRLLADHYTKFAGELNAMNNCEKPTFVPPLTPYKKLGMISIDDQVVVPDMSPSSGGGISDTTPNRGSDSSLLSSDSDSESFNSPNARPSSLQEQLYDAKKGEYGVHDVFLRQISSYEKEVKISNEKLQFAEEEIAKLKRELQNNEIFMVKVDKFEAQLASAENHIKLQEAEIDEENKRSLMLHRQIVDLEAELESGKRQVLELQGGVDRYTTELSDCNLEIKKLNAELQDASGSFALEKWQLESSVSQLSERLVFYKVKAKELEMQRDSLADEINKHEAEKIEMERLQEYLKTSWAEETEHMKSEVCNKNMQLDCINETLDELKFQYDKLQTEKDNAIAEVLAANANLSTCNNHIKHLELTLQEVNCVNKQLTASCDSANKLTAELKSKVDELEKEVGMQAAKINDIGEEKKEAIRQLCFSLNHLRNSYDELRNAYGVMRKRK